MTAINKLPSVMYGSEEAYPIFKRINLETSNYCNRTCSFCPISKGRRKTLIPMKDELYTKIISELYHLNWNGFLSLFHINEPLMHKDILRFATLARTALPQATIYMSTNGDVLERGGRRSILEIIDELDKIYSAGFNLINLNVYDSGPDQFNRFNTIIKSAVSSGLAKYTSHKYRTHAVYKNWITLTDMRVDRIDASSVDMFFDRTDTDRASNFEPMNRQCARTQRHIVIRYDGMIPVCCALDPTSEDVVLVGNVNTHSLVDVWNSEAMFKYRYFTQQGNRSLPGCDTCNHTTAYAHLTRQVEAPDEIKQRWYNSTKAYWQSDRGLVQLSKA